MTFVPLLVYFESELCSLYQIYLCDLILCLLLSPRAYLLENNDINITLGV